MPFSGCSAFHGVNFNEKKTKIHQKISEQTNTSSAAGKLGEEKHELREHKLVNY